jgi:uncharacterized RDD family membrane protein YckC
MSGVLGPGLPGGGHRGPPVHLLALNAATATSLIFLIAGMLAVTSSLQQIYEKVFRQDHQGVQDAVWEFIYFAYSWAASGRTAGMALFGVRVVRDDGTGAIGRRAVVRALAFPLSFLFLGLGFVGILLGGQRRALHDVIAGTAVIYSWDARAARLRFLSRG